LAGVEGRTRSGLHTIVDNGILVDRPSQIGTGRSVVAASRSRVKKLSRVVIHQLIHTTRW